MQIAELADTELRQKVVSVISVFPS